MGHYIHAPVDAPLAWELREEQLAFEPIDGDHSGANMAKIIIRTIDRYDLRPKVYPPFCHCSTSDAGDTHSLLRLAGLQPIMRRIMILPSDL